MNDNDKKALVTEYVNKLKELDEANQALCEIKVFIGITKKFIERHDETSRLFAHEEDELLRKMMDFYLNEKLKPSFDKSDDDM